VQFRLARLTEALSCRRRGRSARSSGHSWRGYHCATSGPTACASAWYYRSPCLPPVVDDLHACACHCQQKKGKELSTMENDATRSRAVFCMSSAAAFTTKARRTRRSCLRGFALVRTTLTGTDSAASDARALSGRGMKKRLKTTSTWQRLRTFDLRGKIVRSSGLALATSFDASQPRCSSWLVNHHARRVG